MTTTTAPPAAEVEEETGGGRRKKLIVVGLVLLMAGAGWWFFLKPAEATEPVPGEILTLEATQINLAGGHYLKVGLALQLTQGAEEVDGSIALDTAIDLFTGLPHTEVSESKQRHKLKRELVTELEERYEGDVMGVYFTEYVTQ